jgi:putative membrane protein
MNHWTRVLFPGILCLAIPAVHGQQVSPADKEFIQKAAQGATHEVQFGKMGLERGSSEAVKGYSQRLVNDHTLAKQEIAELARRKGVILTDQSSAGHGRGHGSTTSELASIAKGGSKTSTGPGRQASSPETDSRNKPGPGNSTYSFPGSDALMGKSGKDFDMEFVRMAIADHQKDIAEFERAANSAGDSDVKVWAAKMLPTLRAHLKDAQSMQSK